MLRDVGWGILRILPVLAIASLLAGALTLGNWSDRALTWVNGGTARSVLVASLIGAVTPVCGLGVLPLIASLLRRGVPLAPIWPFWWLHLSPIPADDRHRGHNRHRFAKRDIRAFCMACSRGIVTAALPLPGLRHDLCAPKPLSNVRLTKRPLSFWAEVVRTPASSSVGSPASVLEVFLQRLVPGGGIMSSLVRMRPHPYPLQSSSEAHVPGRLRRAPLVRGLWNGK